MPRPPLPRHATAPAPLLVPHDGEVEGEEEEEGREQRGVEEARGRPEREEQLAEEWELREEEAAVVRAVDPPEPPRRKEIPPTRLPLCQNLEVLYVMEDKKSATFEEQEEYAMVMGMRFKSEHDGFLFYNNYAKENGFGVRKDYVEHDTSTSMIIYRRYKCFRAGFRDSMYMDLPDRTREPRPVSRCGCAAEFAIKLDRERGDWYVKKFVAKHNHQMAKPDEVPFLRSHRGLSDAQKAEVMELKQVGLRKHQVMEVMEQQYGGYEEVGFVTKDLYNFFDRQEKLQIGACDADRVIKYMHARQQEDMEYYFDYEMDDAGCLNKLFWADPQSRIDYDAFGDVVVFDSTYRVNKYNLPFIPFVGVNHHGSTVIFGCGIVSDETVGTYEWLLRKLLNAMCQRHPKSVITDGDNAMRRAIQTVMPNTDHRLCTWHIEQNMVRHLTPEMLPDFQKFVNAPFEVDEFERRWNEFKGKFDPKGDNRWLGRMYSLRKLWAAAYTKGRVFLGMRSNQRSESLNSNLHRHLDRKMSLVVLVEHYEHCLSRSRHKEAELDAKASQSVPFSANDASQIEKDAAKNFTLSAFKKMRSEIYKAVYWDVIDTIDEDCQVRYVLSSKQNSDKIVLVSCIYDGLSLKSITCPCRKLECEFIPCYHILCVIQSMKVDMIPRCCIKRRWTTSAKSAFASDRYGEVHAWSDQMERYRQLRCVGNETFYKASMTEETTVKVLKYLHRILEEESDVKDDKNKTIYGRVLPESIDTDLGISEKIHDPVPVVPKGAPKRRMRGFIETPKKRVIHCGYCGVEGHTIRTCPEYLRKVAEDV